ncbi:abnormal spindle-like microcephaly-associated protein isoform X2 [Paramisgurnus dabryanus]|uniref:abnormal spindle-like microcephaly-associated protein isoform X2 n=1 Tax=Paramisgurnus dabryanus TaxID=90735 RepID=UPI003CCF702F
MSLKIAQAECLEFSPTFDSHSNVSRGETGKENNNSIPVLSLVQFSRSPFVSFGTIKLGSSKSVPLRIENPTEDVSATVVVDKISTSKGFSVDRTSFTIQPDDSIILNVTWTPVDEGGVRELLCFVANGIVKHQAILLGKAEATKKKKKTLWDSIKSKRGVPAPSKENKLASASIKAANKTFHVSRQSQYSKDRTSNPLSPLNRERTINGSNAVTRKQQSTPPQMMSKPTFVTENFNDEHLQKNSPVVVLIPADQLLNTPDKKDAPFLRKAECKEIKRVLNKTLSPISTPDRLRNPLSSCFQSPLPVIGKLDEEPEKPSLSVKDALDVIGSDLSRAVSPPNACSSFDFSDSLESEKQHSDSTFRVTVDISPPHEAIHPRLTYCVKPNKAIGVESNDNFRLKMTAFSTATVTKFNKVDDTLDPDVLRSKVCVNCTTVTKSKAESSVESPGLRKKKTSRRRLLERTLELSEPSNAESNTSSPESNSASPVISPDLSPDEEKPTAYLSLPVDQPLLSCISPIRSEVLPCVSTNQSTSLDLSTDKGPSCLSLDQFPVQSRTSVPNKKRKSDEFFRDHPEDGLNVQAKKCRAPSRVKETKKPNQEKTFSLKSTSAECSGQQQKFTASSRKFTRPQPKKSLPKSTPNVGRSVKSLSGSTRKAVKVVAVAQAKLTFMKTTHTVIPRHPLPFAAKNMFYDERWIEKQESGFTWWMNYVLTPDDFKVATEVTKVNALSLTLGNEKFNIPKAPTKEEMSFRTYTARQRLNRLRRAACKLFTSDAMVKAIQRLELEVEAKRLLVRKDRHLWKDIGERQKVLNWLLSFNPLWLRIGLETIFGELISLESNSDVVGLAMFILGRLLWNPDIAAEYRHAKVPNLYRDGHEEALSRFTLKKLILLVCFLDKAKESRLIQHDPCLFCMDAEFKSSKDLLLAFSRDFLSGEGILSRHLGHLGLAVSHVQTPLDEFNFAVKNLAVDLRCGIRLVRVMELFTLDWTLSRKLRIPAISRLQKVHNVDVALQVLKDKGVDLRDEHGATIDSRDIVDGHREKTLNLLWKIIFTFQVEVLLDESQLKEEISFLRKTWRTKQKLASLIANKGAVVTKMKATQAFEHHSQKVTLLLDWVNAVCEFYNLKAENFTVSFSDGRVLCYLIHHYHPGYLPVENIQHKTTQTIECGQRGRVELNNSSSESDCSFDTMPSMQESASVDFKELLENEKSNFQLVNTAVSYLGGVPAMINPEDMSNTIPNEKVVTCYLSFLCARLLDLRNETRAARVIQGAWRRYKLQKDIELNRQKNLAATKIQTLVRSFIMKRRLIRQNKAAIVIQAFWRRHAAQEMLRVLKQEREFALQNAAATLIQKKYKAWRIQALIKKNHAASLIQATFRKWHAKKVMERSSAALRIQTWYRMQRCTKQYMEMKRKTICIQAWLRGHHQRCKFQTLKKRHRASIVIQSAFRAYLVRRQISKMEQKAVLIQRWFRACMLRKAERKRYLEVKSAVLTVQAAFRGWHVRRTVAQRNQAALLIQTAFRRFSARKNFMLLKRSAMVLQQRYRAKMVGNKLRLEYKALKVASVTIQAAWRGRAARRKLYHLNRCAEIIQSHYRRYVAQTQFMEMKRAAVVIQRRYRAFREGKKIYAEYNEMKRAAVVLQSAYRGQKARQEIQKRNQAAILIQSVIRAYICRRTFLARKHAAVVVQQRYRAFALGQSHRVRYLQLKQATIKLQALYRGFKIRQNLKRENQAATIIQAQFRMHKVRIFFLAAKFAAIIIQQRYRAFKAGKSMRDSYSQMKNAAVVIQSAFRGMKVRKCLREMHQAATVIQAHFHGHVQLKLYQKQRWAASVFQQRFRAYKTGKSIRDSYLKMQNAAVVIQSAFRGMKVRKHLREMHQAATVIQAHFRGHLQLIQYQKQQWAASVLQQQYRAYKTGKSMRDSYSQMKNAAVVIQSAFRRMNDRRRLREMQQAATVIQAHFRGLLQLKQYQKQQWAASVLQQRYRAYKTGKSMQDSYLRMKNAAVVIQSAFMGMKVRKRLREMHQAATVIQAHFRGHLQLIQYQKQQWAASVLQQRFRAYKTGKSMRYSYLRMKNAAVVIQSAFMGMKVRKRLREMHQAATVIQAHFRGYLQLKQYQKQQWAASVLQQRFRAIVAKNATLKQYVALKTSALRIQSAFRGMMVRKQIAEKHKSAVIIQKTYRMYKQRLDYLSLRNATMCIQQQYRAILSARQQRKAYCSLRTAAITLQSVYRGMRTRKEIHKRHEAATVIQASYRMYRTRVPFQAMRLAAIVIQRQYRCHLLRKEARENFLRLRHSATAIQAIYRGNCTRRNIAKMHAAATIIQRKFLAYKARQSFLSIQAAVQFCQRHYRSVLAARRDRKDYLVKRHAVLVIQSGFRGLQVRQQIRREHAAATIIQSHVRKCIFKLRFQRLRWAVNTIQQRFRAIKIMRQEMAVLKEKKNAAVIIQSAFRGMKVRNHLQEMHQAATVIQAHLRGHLQLKRYQKQQWAASILQKRYRAIVTKRQEIAALKEKKNAAVILQAAYRGMKSRQTLKQMHQAATIIQKTFRACSARKRYLAMKYAAIAIQQRFRAANAAKMQRKHFLEMRQAALVVQACFRGHKVRRTLLRQHQAAILIQSYFRRHREMAKFQAMRLSAIIIQSHYRSHIQTKADRESFLCLRKSAIVIQATFRGHSVRRQLAEKQKAIIIIQAVYRMHQQRNAFKRQQWAARVLQQRFRSLKLRDEQVQRYQQAKKAAVCLQQAFRGMKARKLARRTNAARTIQSYLRMHLQRQQFLKEKAAAIVIQSAYRGYCTRVQHAKMQESAMLIQKWYRSQKLVQEERNGFLALKHATLTLQSALRGMLARRLAKRKQAAIKIQSVLRMQIYRKRYVVLRSSVVKLQAQYRMLAAQRRYRRLQAAAVTLQKHYRAQRAKTEQRCSYLKTLQSIKILQARIRGLFEYRRFQRLRASAMTIQAHYRGMLERRKFQLLKESVCVIQTHYRAFRLCQKERAQFLQLRRSAVVIQTAFRAYQTRQHAVQTQAACKIQAWFRGCLARRNYTLKRAAIATINRCVQARRQRLRFQAVQRSVRIIQQRWRETLIARKQRSGFLKFRKSVICIQALWRGVRVRDSIQKEIKAAVTIQSAFRSFSQRCQYKQQIAAAVTLQRRFRALQLARAKKENLRKRCDAAVCLQAACRGWLARRRIKEVVAAARRHRFSAAVYHHLCAIRIQRAVRAHWTLKAAKRQISVVLYIQQCFRANLQRKRYLKDRRDIIKTQRAVRTWLNRRNQAAVTIQHAVKKFLLKCRKEKLQRGIIKAQALWRGHRSRKLHDTSKVISIRRRFREINRNVKEEDKLCNKTNTALSYLLGYQNYAYILAALKHLETATRLSPECCERLVESGATRTIFILIRSCNRSVPSMEIITLSIQVLLNLSKYHRTIDAVYAVEDSVETLLDLLQIYREKAGDKVADKGGSIFTKACFLLVLLVQDERRAMEVRNLPKTSDRIRSICRLTLRKCKMDAERTKVKQKMNASLNGSFLPQATPRKSKPVARFAPDWVLRRDKMKDIVDPLRAIQTLANALSIVP